MDSCVTVMLFVIFATIVYEAVNDIASQFWQTLFTFWIIVSKKIQIFGLTSLIPVIFILGIWQIIHTCERSSRTKK